MRAITARTAAPRRLGLALVMAIAAACVPSSPRPPTNVIDLRYRMTPARSTAIAIYRWAGERSGSVASRCKMVPTDSEMFAIRASRCSGLAAWYWGVSRLLLEQANSSKFTPPLRVDGRLRRVDMPAPRCSD
jgi:hypothetical protein